ncbi:MAG TPA: hypothetical protein PKZ57_04395 [Methanoregulaceae archaeon]|nr:hypothetical protein [Bacteroidales bacterium]HQM56726.1 hypothetical protein [Methanoregulaceae archaeon]
MKEEKRIKPNIIIRRRVVPPPEGETTQSLTQDEGSIETDSRKEGEEETFMTRRTDYHEDAGNS